MSTEKKNISTVNPHTGVEWGSIYVPCIPLQLQLQFTMRKLGKQQNIVETFVVSDEVFALVKQLTA
jgi:hypothetical protein